MGENNEKKGSLFTVRNVLRILALVCILFVFCPCFLVSCSGQTVEISAMKVAGGLTFNGEKISDPYPVLLICLAVPVIVFLLLLNKEFGDRPIASAIIICSGVDLIIWYIFSDSVKKAAEEYYCTYKSTNWFIVNIVSLVAMILIDFLIVIKKLQMDTGLIAGFTGGGDPVVPDQKPPISSQDSQNDLKQDEESSNDSRDEEPYVRIIGYCPKCGKPIKYGCGFCTSCYQRVPESMIAAAEKERFEKDDGNDEKENEVPQRDIEESVKLVEEAAKREAEEKVRLVKEAVEREVEEKIRLAKEAARREAEEKIRLAEKSAKREVEEKIRLAEEEAKREAEERARLAEEEAKREAEEKARLAEEAAVHETEEIAEKLVKRNEEETELLTENSIKVEDESPKYCCYCGAKVEWDSRFCGNCGREIRKRK